MGLLFSRKARYNILILGLDNAGKTTLIRFMSKKPPHAETIPTAGFSVEKVMLDNIVADAWDVGGQESFRNLWQHYYESASCVIFVIDATDKDRLQDAIDSIKSVVEQPLLAGRPFQVLLNKMDLDNTVTTKEVSEAIGSFFVQGKVKYCIMAVSAKTGEGCPEAINWLKNSLKKSSA
uniref:ADP-ribosylation factor-like protein 6 n=1 Tax=Myxobolus squamalis TaxID=59785 RepID=A0A6B2G894_MYXSQ